MCNIETSQSVLARTFMDIIDSWCSTKNQINFSRNMGDYIEVKLPYSFEDKSFIASHWFIFSHKKDEKITKKIKTTTHNCWEVSLDKDTKDKIKTHLKQSNSNTYIILAKTNKSNIELLDIAPIERFEWYAIELRQYQEEFKSWDKEKKILIPECNQITLSTFSLIWASQWAKEFFSPLSTPELFKTPDIAKKIYGVFNSEFGINRQVIEQQKKFITEDIPSLSDYMEHDRFKNIITKTSIGVAFNEINYLMQSSGETKKIVNYCPEALFGTANLWLFSKPYHTYMEISSNIVEFENNLRLLPIDIQDETESKLMRATVLNVFSYYSNMKVQVRLINKKDINDTPEKDRNYYDNQIGFFPWLTISDDGCHLEAATTYKGDITTNRDFVFHYMDASSLASTLTPHQEIHRIFNISSLSQLLSNGTRKPVFLFEKEDGNFIDHPNNLWVYYD